MQILEPTLSLSGRQTRSCSVERGLSLSSYLLGTCYLNIKFLMFFVLSPAYLRGGSGVKKSLLFLQRTRDLFPDPHTSWLTTAYNSNFKAICSGLLGHLHMPGIHWHKHRLIKNFFKKSYSCPTFKSSQGKRCLSLSCDSLRN